jgi:hypothetical protein
MTEENYKKELIEALNKEKTSILTNLNAFLQKIPFEAVRINIIISFSQDGEVDFCIHGGLDGPNMYHLNTKVEDWTNILDIKHGTNGFEPDFPMVDPFSIEFEINEVVVASFIEWFDDNWSEIDNSKVNVGIVIYSDHI